MRLAFKLKFKQAPSFTMVELAAVMAIIAVLMVLGLYGIRTIQIAGRDDTRVSKLTEIQSAVDIYYRTTGKYPALGTTFTWLSDGSVQVGSRRVDLPGHTVNAIGSYSDTTQTYYIYAVDTTGYRLCAKLENGSWYNVGSSAQKCT